jgi:alpha-D-xyloside xylohydrolase
VFLPSGAWVDAWSGSELEGPCTVERRVPLDEIPVYVRRERAGELRPLFS